MQKNNLPKIFKPNNSLLLRRNFEQPFNNIFDELVNEFFSDFIPAKTSSFNYITGTYPKCDIKEYPDKYLIEMEIVGLNKDDLKIKYDEKNELLTISGNKQQKKEEENVNYIVRELKKSSFLRSFYIDKNEIKGQFNAKHNNGLLTIEIPKKEEVIEPKQEEKIIEIK